MADDRKRERRQKNKDGRAKDAALKRKRTEAIQSLKFTGLTHNFQVDPAV